MEVRVFQLHKQASYEYKYIQDRFSIGQIPNSNIYALSDGTTQSFNSEIWAKSLSEAFVKKPIFNPKAFISECKDLAKEFKQIKFTFSENPAKASLEKEKIKRGATSTFIGVEIDSNNCLNIISVGDSNLFIKRGNSIFKYPFKTLEELDSNNNFLNTEKLLSNDIDETVFNTTRLQLSDNDIIVLGTDALSRFFLKAPNRISTFLILENFEDFHRFCVENWENKSLEEDDISGIVIKNTPTSSFVKEILPPSGFSFIKEQEAEFVPSKMVENNFNNQINNNDMQEIFNYLNSINRELVNLRKKATLQQILLFSVIIIGIINIFLMINLNLSKPQKVSTNIAQPIIETSEDNNAKVTIDSPSLKHPPAATHITPQKETAKGVLNKSEDKDSATVSPPKKVTSNPPAKKGNQPPLNKMEENH
jgi:hypothetical protein